MANPDGSLWITYNGEVFNYAELRRTLELRGQQFRTASSTVALIHQLFWNGLHGRPLVDTLETYRRLMFGVQ
jgi:asparagine synthetase B (glutamine-hydrolysing)